MAKKKDDYSDVELKKGNKILSIIISLLIILILLGIFAICVKLDVGGIGNKVFRPLFKDVPGINKILPEPTDDMLIDENNYGYANIAEAVAQIKKLEEENDKLKKENDDISSKLSDSKSETARLKEFEEKQAKYEKLIKDFNENIVFNDKAPDITEYKKYYEGIDPSNAAAIYRQVIEQLQAEQSIVDLANTYSKMEPKAAADALQQVNDISLTCQILSAMSQKNMAAIMDQMPAEYAADVTEKIKSLNS